ncbi:uncharacterized protein LOC113344250 isoform X3 [Papaver somniferum]|nr:uncharacterized protein LOC113344250 isoform X3 [Papaver somniferum]
MEIQLCQRIITGDSVKMSYTAGVTMVSRTLWVVKMPSVLISLQRKNQRFGMPSSLQLENVVYRDKSVTENTPKLEIHTPCEGVPSETSLDPIISIVRA